MKRRPSELVSTPPSPRTDSVTRRPRTLGGQIMPVGWNCMNSISTRLLPALSASAWPSPVPSHELLVTLKDLPIPPVARMTAGASKSMNRPDSREYARAPATSPSFVMTSVTVVSANTLMRASASPNSLASFCCSPTIACCIVRIISKPVRSPTWARRGYSCPPKLRWLIFPSAVRSKSAPQVSSSQTRSGDSLAWSSAIR